MSIKSLFRMVGWLEALSFIVLLAIAMPLKYAYDMPTATRFPGAIHGGLFVAYILLAHALADREKWPARTLLMAYAASILPLGTIFFDRKLLQEPTEPAAT